MKAYVGRIQHAKQSLSMALPPSIALAQLDDGTDSFVSVESAPEVDVESMAYAIRRGVRNSTLCN